MQSFTFRVVSFCHVRSCHAFRFARQCTLFWEQLVAHVIVVGPPIVCGSLYVSMCTKNRCQPLAPRFPGRQHRCTLVSGEFGPVDTSSQTPRPDRSGQRLSVSATSSGSTPRRHDCIDESVKLIDEAWEAMISASSPRSDGNKPRRLTLTKQHDRGWSRLLLFHHTQEKSHV